MLGEANKLVYTLHQVSARRRRRAAISLLPILHLRFRES